MLLGILHCLITRRRFALSSRRSPYLQPSGWREYFEPFCPHMENSLLDFLDTRWFPGSFRSDPKGHIRRFLLLSVVRPALFPGMETVIENWGALFELKKQDHVDISLDGERKRLPLRAALSAIHQDVWRPNEKTRTRIEAGIAGLALPARYAAIQIRRGDKNLENPHIGEEIYVKRLEGLSTLKDVYVATDDYRCVEALRRLRPGWNIWSLCPPGMRGHFQLDFVGKPGADRREATLRLLTEVKLLTAAEIYVGTFSSGVGENQGIARASHTYGVDFADWKLN